MILVSELNCIVRLLKMRSAQLCRPHAKRPRVLHSHCSLLISLVTYVATEDLSTNLFRDLSVLGAIYSIAQPSGSH